jgi:hypothetical protein
VPLRPVRVPEADVDQGVRSPRAFDVKKNVREVDLELFRTRVPAEPSKATLSSRTRAAAAATLAIAALAASFVIGLNVGGRDHRLRDPWSTHARTASQAPIAAPAPPPRAQSHRDLKPANVISR